MKDCIYISDKGDFCRVTIDDKKVTYNENNDIEKAFNLHVVKKCLLPIEPKIYEDKIILFDYDKGVEIIETNNYHFINVRAVWDSLIIKNNLLLFTHKKLYNYSLNDFSLVNEINLSENCEISKANDCIVLYRLKNNKSFIYDSQKDELVLLNNMIKDDLLIYNSYNNLTKLYLLTSKGILVYDYTKEMCYFDFSCETLVTGNEFDNLWPFTPNTSIILHDNSYSKDNLKRIFLKYGQFYLTKIVDPSYVEDVQLKKLLIEQLELLDNSNIITYEDFSELLKKFAILGKKLKEAFN